MCGTAGLAAAAAAAAAAFAAPTDPRTDGTLPALAGLLAGPPGIAKEASRITARVCNTVVQFSIEPTNYKEIIREIHL